MEVSLKVHFNISMAGETRSNSPMLYFTTSIYNRKGAANEMGPHAEDRMVSKEVQDNCSELSAYCLLSLQHVMASSN